jgi:N utilization substance protein B
VDRNVLRIAVCELLHEPSLVPAIVIDEAIEIARKYSGDEAAVFVNGVLDAVRKSTGREGPPAKKKSRRRTP